MATTRTHIVLPIDLMAEIERYVGKRRRSQFLAEAAAREIMRLKQRIALDEAAGAWKAQDHPELRSGSAAWVRKLRRQADRKAR